MTETQQPVMGRVVAIHRYPIKSMIGEVRVKGEVAANDAKS